MEESKERGNRKEEDRRSSSFQQNDILFQTRFIDSPHTPVGEEKGRTRGDADVGLILSVKLLVPRMESGGEGGGTVPRDGRPSSSSLVCYVGRYARCLSRPIYPPLSHSHLLHRRPRCRWAHRSDPGRGSAGSGYIVDLFMRFRASDWDNDRQAWIWQLMKLKLGALRNRQPAEDLPETAVCVSTHRWSNLRSTWYTV